MAMLQEPDILLDPPALPDIPYIIRVTRHDLRHLREAALGFSSTKPTANAAFADLKPPGDFFVTPAAHGFDGKYFKTLGRVVSRPFFRFNSCEASVFDIDFTLQ